MKQMRFSTLADISKNEVYQNKKLSKKEMCGLLSLNTKKGSHKKKNFYGDDFFDIKKSRTIYNMHIYWTKQNPFVIAELIHHYTKPDDFVLDAFCGSGMTGVAAKIVGRNAILIDLSPSAIHVSRNYTTLTDPESFKGTFTKIYEDVYKELIWMFRTKCHVCGNENALVESTILSDVYACPYCSKGVIYGNEQRWSSLKKGAKIKTITCDHCASKFNIKDAKFLRRIPIEIRVRCNKCKVSGKNKIKKLSKEDMKLYKKIEDMRIPYSYPEDVRFFGWEPKRNIKKGIYYPYQMFSKRNLYVLAAFWDKINKIENKKIKEKLQFLFTGALFNVSLMVRWHHKYDVVVTGTRTRKGTLYIPPIINDANPFIPFKVKSNTIYRGLKKLLELYKRDSICFVEKGSAMHLGFIPDASIDYVYCDPPYGSNIDYSGINLMWEAWLNDIVDTKEEVVENVDQGKTIEDYKNMLIRSFKEVHRVLKDECFFSLVFSYSLPLMWRVVQEASFNADFKSDFNIITISSKSKTAVQSVSLKAQQRFFIITFKKSNVHMRTLKKCPDFNGYITKNIKNFLLSHPESTYDKIYDYLIKKCWKDGVLIENFDLAKILLNKDI